MAASKGCWTCKDRKVSCDRTVPRCTKCLKSRRQCGGYGIRLTWPKPNKHGEIEITSFEKSNSIARKGEAPFVNVTSTDIRLHHAATSRDDQGKNAKKDYLTVPSVPEIYPQHRNTVPISDDDLLRYFETDVIPLLPGVFFDRTNLRRFLKSSILSNNSQSSRAVTQAALALAAYQHGEADLRTDHFKRSSLRQLYTHTNMTSCEAGEHIIANLLLCVLEMQQAIGYNSAWIGYLCGAKEVLDVFKHAPSCSSDFASVVLGWGYYFDIMARFSFRHWRTESVKSYAVMLGFDDNGIEECFYQYIIAQKSFAKSMQSASKHAHPIIQLLAEVSETILYSSNPRYFNTEYRDHLKELRSGLENTGPDHPENDAKTLLELLRLAGLIYLERVSKSFSGQSAEIDLWTRQALSIMSEMEVCFCPFALFIVGCEISQDQDRMVILDLYARMEKVTLMQNLLHVKSLIQTAWNQEDLREGEQLDYITKLNLVLSTRDFVPSFI